MNLDRPYEDLPLIIRALEYYAVHLHGKSSRVQRATLRILLLLIFVVRLSCAILNKSIKLDLSDEHVPLVIRALEQYAAYRKKSRNGRFCEIRTWHISSSLAN